MLDAHQAPDAHARPPLPDLAIDRPASPARPVAGDALFAAARSLLPVLEAGRPLDAATLRDAMTRAFGASDASRAAGSGKTPTRPPKPPSSCSCSATAGRCASSAGRRMRMAPAPCSGNARRPSPRSNPRTRSARKSRSACSSSRRRCPWPMPRSKPPPSGRATPCWSPRAGTGMLAVMAECAMGARAPGHFHLNEYAETRARLLTRLFPQATVTAFDAEAIADRLHDVRPTAVIMNPPFSATPGVERIRHDADLRHLRSAFSMLPPGGRLAAITSAHCVPGDAAWRDTFDSVEGGARTVFTMAIDGRAYARRGTGFDTRLTVIERSSAPGIDIDREAHAANAAALLDAVIARVPPRLPITPEAARPVPTGPARDLFGKPVSRAGHASAGTGTGIPPPHPQRSMTGDPSPSSPSRPAFTDAYAAPSDSPAGGPHRPLRSVAARRWCGCRAPIEHPTPLVQSAAMAAVPHPVPSYRPMLPELRGDGRAPVRRPARKRRAGGRGPRPPSRRRLPDRLRLGDRAALPRRTTATMTAVADPTDVTDDGEGAVRAGALPARLDAGRRHRRGEGPPGRRHPARQLAARPEARPLAVPVRQAGSRTRGATGARFGGREDDVIALGKFRQGAGDPALRGHPLRYLRDAALAGPPGEDRRASTRSSPGSPAHWTGTTATASTVR